uniref:Uncharacterized protein n=1 Tax=Oryza meridionalis TaxID=40149 RepID=A0A0E0C6Q3_9ORYZ
MYSDGFRASLTRKNYSCNQGGYARNAAMSVSMYRRGLFRCSSTSSAAGPITRSAARLCSDATDTRARRAFTRTRCSTLRYSPLLSISRWSPTFTTTAPGSGSTTAHPPPSP